MTQNQRLPTTNGDFEALKRQVEALERALANIEYPGILKVFAGSIAPTGYLLCDGSSYAINDYPSLFVVLGGLLSPYGVPDSDHFNVPDIRDRVAVGASSTIPLGSSGGAKTHVLTAAEMPSHVHGLSALKFTGGGANTIKILIDGQGSGVSQTTDATGANGGHNNMQPYLSLNWIVKT